MGTQCCTKTEKPQFLGEHVNRNGVGRSTLIALMTLRARSMRARRTKLQFSRHAANASVKIFGSIFVRLQDAWQLTATYGSSCPIENGRLW
jgi:hypothetical protein